MKRKNESGQALVFTAVGMVCLLGFVGLGIDMGMLRYQRRLQQSAADAAAIAAATNIGYTGSIAAGQTAAASTGFTDNGGGQVSTCSAAGAAVGTVCVQINVGPQSGPHQFDPLYAEALVVAVHPTYFMKIFGVNKEAVMARAVATNTSGGPVGGAGCIYTLGTPSKQLNANNAGVGVSGSVILNAPTCGIVDNGNMVANGGTQLSITAGSIGVGGVYNAPSGSATVTPTPQTGMPYSGDPFFGKYPSISVGGVSGTIRANSGSVTTFIPGTYSGGTINAGAQVVFTPGVYVISGGTLRINGGAKVCGGGTVSDWSDGAWSNTSTPPCTYSGGVTFYITNNATVTVNGLAAVQMYAPNSGPYEGLLFYQDPSDTHDMTLSGTSVSLYQGAIYLPTATLSFGGNTNFNNGAAYTVIVVDQLQLAGNPDVNLKSDFSGLAGGGGPLVNAIRFSTLVE